MGSGPAQYGSGYRLRMNIQFLAEANAEAIFIKRWYEGRSATAGSRFQRSFDEAIACIHDAPERWPEGDKGTRFGG